ncbi:MAG TPA: hypothetical protein DGX96_02230 [Lachnospiraceae bacterium]|nr:hypothetical protein [Lachnospiraceae bacterium]
MAIRLGKRLQLIADMTAEQAGGTLTVCDVGTDHAHIPIYLLQTNGCGKAIAMDVADGPLAIAKTNLELAGLEDHCELRKSDGLKTFTKGEAQVLVIAGMGGILMRQILEEDPEKTKSFQSLVLSPHSEPQLVRSFLRKNKIGIRKERAVFEDGKYYTVLSASPGQEMIRPDWDGYQKQIREMPQDTQKSAGITAQTAEILFADPLFRQEMEDLYGPCLIRNRDPVLREYVSLKLKSTLQLLSQMQEINQEERSLALKGKAGALQALLFLLTFLS